MFQGLSFNYGRMFQGLSFNYGRKSYSTVFPGSEIPEWFSHQCTGDEVNIMEPFSHLCNEWIGIAICIVFCSLPCRPYHNFNPVLCQLRVNGIYKSFIPSRYRIIALSDHIWLLYVLPQFFLKEEDIKSLWECDANGFCEFGIKIYRRPIGLVKKCGLHLVYKKDIKDLNNAMAQCSSNNIIPYEGFDVPHHNFNNSAVIVEVNKND